MNAAAPLAQHSQCLHVRSSKQTAHLWDVEDAPTPQEGHLQGREACNRVYQFLGPVKCPPEPRLWQPSQHQMGVQALSTAEGISGDSHPRVAIVLLVLGNLYARTARVTYAEGLYRYG